MIDMVGGIFGSDVKRDGSAGINHMTLYHRRTRKPIYIECPYCQNINHYGFGDGWKDIAPEQKEHMDLHCPCGKEFHCTEENIRFRCYTRLGAVEIGGWG